VEKNVTALVVDDDRATQRLLADALTREGFSVMVEKDGEWALRSFQKKRVDVVLLDLMLPAIPGFEVARRIRTFSKGRNVPIVFLSGVFKANDLKAEAESRYGIVDFLEKPLSLPRLKAILKNALGPGFPKAGRAEERPDRIEAWSAEGYADDSALAEVAKVEQEAKRSALRTIRGTFEQKPFPELLTELYRWKASGALLLRRDQLKKIVYFREGRPYSVKSNLLSECLGELMIREKMISEASCKESLKRMKSSGRLQGTVLIEMGCISPHNLAYALALQLQTKLYDIFTWTKGGYQFSPNAELPGETTTLDLTTAQIIYQGVKRAYDPKRVRAALGKVESFYVHPAADPLLRFQEVGLDEEESALLAMIDGRKTVASLVALNLLAPLSALKFLYAMRCSQMIELRPEPAEGPAEPLPLHPPPLPRSASARRKGSSGPLLPELADTVSASVPTEEREVRERLAAAAASMKKKDYFEILGVTPRDGEEEIRRAYFRLTKEYHPDKHFGSSSAELRGLAAQIFDLVSIAHDTLVDPEERKRYLSEIEAGGGKELPGDISQILVAEGRFQNGAELLRNRQFQKACVAFGEAVDHYPEEGEFHAYLGWSLFLAQPNSEGSAQKAIEHIERGIRLNPKVDKSYLFLGYIEKALGRPDRAERQFEKAIHCNPDCIEGLRELRLLEEKIDRQ
jgi:DNA-binding response OmpR family regulator